MNVGKAVLVILVFCSGFFSCYGFEKLDPDLLKKSAVDTNLTGFQHSRPGIGAYFYNQTLGNLGSAMRMIYFWDEEQEFFNAGLNAFKVYQFSEEMNFALPKIYMVFIAILVEVMLSDVERCQDKSFQKAYRNREFQITCFFSWFHRK